MHGAAAKESLLTTVRREIQNTPDNEKPYRRVQINSAEYTSTLETNPPLNHAMYAVPYNVEALSLEITNTLLTHVAGANYVVKIIYEYWGSPNSSVKHSSEEDIIKAELLQFSNMWLLRSINEGIVYKRENSDIPAHISAILIPSHLAKEEQRYCYCFNPETKTAQPFRGESGPTFSPPQGTAAFQCKKLNVDTNMKKINGLGFTNDVLIIRNNEYREFGTYIRKDAESLYVTGPFIRLLHGYDSFQTSRGFGDQLIDARDNLLTFKFRKQLHVLDTAKLKAFLQAERHEDTCSKLREHFLREGYKYLTTPNPALRKRIIDMDRPAKISAAQKYGPLNFVALAKRAQGQHVPHVYDRFKAMLRRTFLY
jgi:hypothetical protein